MKPLIFIVTHSNGGMRSKDDFTPFEEFENKRYYNNIIYRNNYSIAENCPNRELSNQQLCWITCFLNIFAVKISKR